MTKYLLLIAFGWIVWWLWRKPRRQDSESPRISPQRAAERMVVCAHCGVNQPLSESIQAGERYFCCPAHQRDAEAAGD